MPIQLARSLLLLMDLNSIALGESGDAFLTGDGEADMGINLPRNVTLSAQSPHWDSEDALGPAGPFNADECIGQQHVHAASPVQMIAHRDRRRNRDEAPTGYHGWFKKSCNLLILPADPSLSSWVLASLDVVKHMRSCRIQCEAARSVDPFVHEQLQKAFAGRVVAAMPHQLLISHHRTHRQEHAQLRIHVSLLHLAQPSRRVAYVPVYPGPSETGPPTTAQ